MFVASMMAVASLFPLNVPNGVPASVVEMARHSISLTDGGPPSDFPWNVEKYFNLTFCGYTFTPDNMTYGNLVGTHTTCHPVCSDDGTCPNPILCQACKDCQQPYFDSMWKLRKDMIDEMSGCCLTSNPYPCLQDAYEYWMNIIELNAEYARECTPACP